MKMAFPWAGSMAGSVRVLAVAQKQQARASSDIRKSMVGRQSVHSHSTRTVAPNHNARGGAGHRWDAKIFMVPAINTAKATR